MSEQGPAEDLEDLYETAPCGYLSISPNALIVKANRTIAGWLGREPEQLVGKSLHEILSFGGRIAYETHLAPLLRMQGHVHEIALDLLQSDGGRIPTIANAAEKREADGRHLFTRLTLFKAVDRRSYERGLLNARDRAEAESRAQRGAVLLRDQFIAVLGHDLRNPLAAIAAGLQMLAKREKFSEAGQTLLSEINESVERASSLISDVLDLARGSFGGGFIVRREPNALVAPIIAQVVAEIRAIAPERAIEAHIAIDGPICCDRGRVGQLASNLLANAVAHGAADQPIRVEATTRDDLFIFSVANGGTPIPQDVCSQLFQPFFRASVQDERKGLGLGLFIASEIARAHDGKLEVQSSDRETRFTFTMPRADPQQDRLGRTE